MTEGISVIHVTRTAGAALRFGGEDTTVTVERVAEPSTAKTRYADVDCVVVGPGFESETLVSFCRSLARRAPTLPVVVYTESGSEELAGDVVAAGADGYIPATAGPSTLESRLLDLVEREAHRQDTLDGRAVRSAHPGSIAWNELVVEQSPLAIVEWNRSFEAVRWNDAATELFGYEAEEILGESALDVLVPEPDRAAVVDHWETLVETGESDRRRGRNVRKDGRNCICEWHNTPLVVDGEVVRILSFVEDVTDDITRADALDALQTTTHRLMRATSRAEIASIAIESVTSVIDGVRAGFRYLDPDANELVLEAATEPIESTVEGTRLGPGDGVLWESFERGEARILTDVDQDIVPYDLGVEIRDVIVMPIADDGLLTVASREEASLGEAEYHLVDVLGATASVAIERVDHDRARLRAKTIVETVGDGVYALDEDGRFTTVNDRLEAMCGYDRETLLGSHVSLLFPDATTGQLRFTDEPETESASADDRPAESLREGSRSSDTVRTTEQTLRTASDDELPCEVTSTTLERIDQAIGTVGIVRDVSDRKAMKREILEHQRKVTTLHEVVGRLEACETKTAIFEETVDAAEGVLQFDVCVVSEAVGDHLEIRVLSEGVDTSQLQMRRSMDAGLGGRAYRNGETCRVDDVSTAPEANPQDEAYQSGLSVPVGEYGVFQAISTEPAAFDERDEELAELLISHVVDALDRLAYEEQLVAERDRFAVLFENVPDAVVTGRHVDAEFIVEEANTAFEETFGFDVAELEGEPIDAYIAPPDRRERAREINSLSEAGEVIETEVKRQTTDGLRDFMLRVVPYDVDDDGEYAFGLYTDVTEQKQRQKRVEVLNRVLRHDLRNGMNIIEGSAERLATMSAEDDAERYARAIRERTNELIGLAEKTRAVERTLDRDTVATGPIDAADAVERAITRLTRHDSTVTVERSLLEEAPVRADDLLVDAVYNVLENAVQHTDRDEPTIGVTMRPVADDPDTLSIAVADDGPGIPDEERQLLEEEREITQLRHASGLGLWLVDWVVTQSGGELRFEANDPRGTIVELRLPRTDADDARPGAAEAER